MNRILIAGAGAMGTIIGALLSERLMTSSTKSDTSCIGASDFQVELLDINASHINQLNDHGAKIEGHLDTLIDVNAITPDQLSGQYDLVISTVKQTGLVSSLKQLIPFLHDKSLVITLQNGLPEDLAAEVIGSHYVIGGGMEFSGTFIKEGVVELASPIDTLGFTIGESDGEITPRLLEVQNILKTVASCEVTTKLREARFTKLTDNTVASAIPTALGCLLGEVLNDDRAMACMAELGRECSLVMQGLSIQPLELFGFKPSPENIYFNNDSTKQTVIEYWRETYAPYHQQTASMLQDLQQGRLTEVDYINGKMLSEAEKLGLKMPMNQAVINAIKNLQSQQLPLKRAWDQLDYLTLHIS